MAQGCRMAVALLTQSRAANLVHSLQHLRVGGRDCLLARSPIPFLEIHGGLDKGVHYAGGMGYGGPLPPIPVWYALLFHVPWMLPLKIIQLIHDIF